jgi:carboxylesterase
MIPDPGEFDLCVEGGGNAAVLCLHGLAGTPWDVRLPAEHLAALGFRCVGPVLPGHCTSPVDLARTPARAWLDAALARYDALAQHHERVYVLGLSMGGVLALALCQRRSPRAAVLLAVPLRIRPSLRLPVRLLYRSIHSVRRIPGIADPVAREANPGYRRMPLAAVHSLIGLQQAVCADLPRVSQPLLLIYSAKDRTVELANAQRIRAAVSSPRVELLQLKQSGHVIGVDLERDQVAQHSARFLLELDASAD